MDTVFPHGIYNQSYNELEPLLYSKNSGKFGEFVCYKKVVKKFGKFMLTLILFNVYRPSWWDQLVLDDGCDVQFHSRYDDHRGYHSTKHLEKPIMQQWWI